MIRATIESHSVRYKNFWCYHTFKPREARVSAVSQPRQRVLLLDVEAHLLQSPRIPPHSSNSPAFLEFLRITPKSRKSPRIPPNPLKESHPFGQRSVHLRRNPQRPKRNRVIRNHVSVALARRSKFFGQLLHLRCPELHVLIRHLLRFLPPKEISAILLWLRSGAGRASSTGIRHKVYLH